MQQQHKVVYTALDVDGLVAAVKDSTSTIGPIMGQAPGKYGPVGFINAMTDIGLVCLRVEFSQRGTTEGLDQYFSRMDEGWEHTVSMVEERLHVKVFPGRVQYHEEQNGEKRTPPPPRR